MSNPVSRKIIARDYKGDICTVQMESHVNQLITQDFPKELAKRLGITSDMYLNFDSNGVPYSVTTQRVHAKG